MPVPPLAVLSVGLVSGVGLTAAQSCAAIRCGINNFQETRFVGNDGEPLVGSAVELKKPRFGILKLIDMAIMALRECLDAAMNEKPEWIPLLLCISEEARPGRFEGLAQYLLEQIQRELGIGLHPRSRVLELGRVGGVVALLQARQLLSEGRCARVVVVGVDSFLVDETLSSYERADRLLTRVNSNGFIPGEAAGAVLLGAWQEGVSSPLLCNGFGFAREPAPLGSGKPLRAEGLMQAIRAALDEAGLALQDCDHRVADVSGEQYRFKEAALAIMRLLRDRKVLFSLWHLADCIGEVGGATLPAMLAMLFMGARKNYLPGRTFLGHLGNDDDRRAAFVAQATKTQTLALEMAAEATFSLKRRSAA
jgi:3-oxoacyl-[acyl-carrier-protein] synthase I